MKKELNITSHEGNANPKHHEKPLHTHYDAVIRQLTARVDEGVERLELLSTTEMGVENGAAALGNSLAVTPVKQGDHMTQQFHSYVYFQET